MASTVTTPRRTTTTHAHNGAQHHDPSMAGRRGRRWQLALLIVLVIVFALPFYVMVSAAFKTPLHASVSTLWHLPNPVSLEGIREAWAKLLPNFWTSIVVVVPAVAISCVVGAFNGFLISKYTFRFSNLMFSLMLVGMFIPYQAVLIPIVRFLDLMSLYGTVPGLILVHVVYGIPITTLIFRNYYVSVPKALVEAATVDGAGIVRIFRSIVMPISLPGFVVAGIFQFTNIWNDFLFGVVVIPNPSKQPVTVALYNLAGTQSVNWNVMMAGALIAAVPTVAAYLGLGRYFVQGLTAGAVK
ncbi:MAG TPA: carbohydrate ABC transporter permease [Acidothermaceae bacterium]|jgi:glucose/mannose transport system permease protein